MLLSLKVFSQLLVHIDLILKKVLKWHSGLEERDKEGFDLHLILVAE